MKTDQSGSTLNQLLSIHGYRWRYLCWRHFHRDRCIYCKNTAHQPLKRISIAPDAALELVIAATSWGYAVFLITGSRTGDYLGKKKVFANRAGQIHPHLGHVRLCLFNGNAHCVQAVARRGSGFHRAANHHADNN